jgi:hypothetical protein
MFMHLARQPQRKHRTPRQVTPYRPRRQPQPPRVQQVVYP